LGLQERGLPKQPAWRVQQTGHHLLGLEPVQVLARQPPLLE